MVGAHGGPNLAGQPSEEVESGRLAELFGLLSDQSRAGILYALLEAGELSIADLSLWAGLSPTRASEALRVLRSAQVVSSRRSGESVLYDLRGDDVRKLLEVAGAGSAARRLWQLRGLDAGFRSA